MTSIAERKRLKAARDVLLSQGDDINPQLAQRFAVSCMLFDEALNNILILAKVNAVLLRRLAAVEQLVGLNPEVFDDPA